MFELLALIIVVVESARIAIARRQSIGLGVTPVVLAVMTAAVLHVAIVSESIRLMAFGPFEQFPFLASLSIVEPWATAAGCAMGLFAAWSLMLVPKGPMPDRALPRSAFSPPPPPPEERPDTVSQRIDVLSREQIRHSLDASVSHISLAAVLGLLVPVVAAPVAIATRFTADSVAGSLTWTLALVGAAAMTALAGAVALALPRRHSWGDHGRYRPATGAMAAMTAGCMALFALVVSTIVGRGWPVAMDLTNALLAGSAAIVLITLMAAARGLRAGSALTRMAGQAALSFADALPIAIGTKAAEQRRRAVARAAESTLAGHDLLTEHAPRVKSVALLALILLGAIGASGWLSYAPDASWLSLGLAGGAALLLLVACEAAIDAAIFRPHRAGSLVPLCAGCIAAGAALHLGWLATNAPTIPATWQLGAFALHVVAAILAAVSAARLHPVRRYDGAVPSVPALVDALRSSEAHVRQPAHQLLIRMAEVDLKPDFAEWRRWMETELDRHGRLPVEA